MEMLQSIDLSITEVASDSIYRINSSVSSEESRLTFFCRLFLFSFDNMHVSAADPKVWSKNVDIENT